MKGLYTALFLALSACSTSFNKTLTCTKEVKDKLNIEMMLVYTQDEIISYTLVGDSTNEADIQRDAKKIGVKEYAREMKTTLEKSGFQCSLANTAAKKEPVKN